MKIIEIGSNVDNWSKQVVCYDCKSKLEITEEDLKWSYREYKYGCDTHGGYDDFHYICPICQYHNCLSQVLNIIKQRVKQKYLQLNPTKNWFSKLFK